MSLYIKTTSLLQTLESKVDSLYTRFACARVLYAIACTFLGFVIALFLLATLGFIAHIPINKFYLPIAFILSLMPLFTLRKMRLGGGSHYYKIYRKPAHKNPSRFLHGVLSY